MSFSVLISVYFKENATHFDMALNSLFIQTLLPNEIILIKDGPLNKELESVIKKYLGLYPTIMNVITLKENKGLGYALKIGVAQCKFEIIARMDTDDIARPQRFEKQIEFLQEHPEIDIVGSNLEEFNKVPGDLNRFKINIETHKELIARIKLRSPFNHPTVMMRKAALLKAGSYNDNLLLFEDYSLFLRMWLTGAKFYNIQEVLLDFRIGSGIGTIKRRSGIHYIEKEKQFLKYAEEIGAFNKMEILRYKLLKFPIRIMPPRVVLFIYNTFLRQQK